MTIVEGPADEGSTQTDLARDALNRCLDSLFTTVRALRLSENEPIPELTYERVPMVVPFIWRELHPPNFIGEPALIMLSHGNFATADVDVDWDDDHERRYLQYLGRLQAGDPLVTYSERRLEARLALNVQGQYAESVIQSAIAAEVLIQSILMMMLWEESIPEENPQEAASVLGSRMAARLSRHYASRLGGGGWNLSDGGPVERWHNATANVRNRIVHAGYRPSRAEAESAYEALADLELFICDRLGSAAKKYPRTALMMLGRNGLERRGAWRGDIFGEQAIGPILDQIRAYVSFRSSVTELMLKKGTDV